VIAQLLVSGVVISRRQRIQVAGIVVKRVTVAMVNMPPLGAGLFVVVLPYGDVQVLATSEGLVVDAMGALVGVGVSRPSFATPFDDDPFGLHANIISVQSNASTRTQPRTVHTR